MSDLLKEAIADAKAVRETALANAKMALEEAFTPQLKSMLSAKLREDEDEEFERFLESNRKNGAINSFINPDDVYFVEVSLKSSQQFLFRTKSRKADSK